MRPPPSLPLPLFIHTPTITEISYAAGVYRDSVMYVQQCMLGSNIYGVPIARRSDGETIATRCNLANWVEYPLPKPWPRVGPQYKITCFKPLSLFLVSAELESIQAFNHGANPWDLLDRREEASAVSITYNDVDEFLHIGAAQKAQHDLRAGYVIQCARLGLPSPVFKGLVCFMPAFNNAQRRYVE